VSGTRLVVGFLVMGIAVPVALFLLLGLHDVNQLLTIAACTFLPWGVADFLATVLERPRLRDRSPGKAFRENLEQRATEPDE
jgi:hypothetical protein